MQRAMLATAGLRLAGGVISAIGIRNPQRAQSRPLHATKD
jgi:hypothetical protein